jgi:Fe-S-cluster-containing dehydrogenase component
MSKMAMVIDLHKCVGCGACAIACKTENNTQRRTKTQSFNWADFSYETTGRFPKISHTSRPVLCNHCTDAACVEVCPAEPKAMFKTENGITMHNDDRCIGCQSCQDACPYSALEVSGGEWSVISHNDERAKTHKEYRQFAELIEGCTASGAEMSRRARAIPPFETQYDHPDYESVRKPGVVEKCVFCAHRVVNGDDPYCAATCPSHARTFGDLDDASSDVAKLLNKYPHAVLQPEAGTKPNVYYIRSFQV